MPKNLDLPRKSIGASTSLCLVPQATPIPTGSRSNRAKQLGGHVSSKVSGLRLWCSGKWLEREQENPETGDTETVNVPLLRYYKVFNVEQCDGIPEDKIPPLENTRDFHPIEQAETVVQDMPQRPIVKHEAAQAYYRPSDDVVNMPSAELFQSSEGYYSTLFHELTHATGHESRLKRLNTDKLAPFGSRDYSQEELVAEMGAAFLCGHCQIENQTLDNSAAYIRGLAPKAQKRQAHGGLCSCTGSEGF